MRGLLEAGAVLLAPALAGAVSLDDTIPSAFITLHLPESEDAATTQDLIFRLDIQESADACGYGNVSINGERLLEDGSGSFTVDDDRVMDATWDITCVLWDDVPQEQLLSLNVEAVNGVPIEDVGMTLRFQQVAPVWISDVEGSASMTRVHSVNQGKPHCDDDDEVDVDAELAELDFLRWQVAEMSKMITMKERRLSQVLGWAPHHGRPMIEECDSIKCAISVLYHKVKDTAYSIYGGDDFPGRHGPRPHGQMSGPRHHDRPHGEAKPHGGPRTHGDSPFPQFGHHHNHTRNDTHPHPHPPHRPHFGHPPPFCKCGPQFPHPPGPPHRPPHGPPPPGPPPHGPQGDFPHPKQPETPGHAPGHHEDEHDGPSPPSQHDHHAPGPHGPDARPHEKPSPEGHKKPVDGGHPKSFKGHADETPERVQVGEMEEDSKADEGAVPAEMPAESELRRDPYYEENHPPHSGSKEHPHDGPHHEPPMHDGPEDFPPPPPFDHDGPPSEHDGPPFEHDRPPFDHDGPPFEHDGPPFDHDGPPFEHDGPFGHDGGPPAGHHHGPPPHGMILMHVASAAASIILLGIFVRVLHQRCARRSPQQAFSHRRRRSYSGAPWYKRVFFGPQYYQRLDEEEKEAMLRDCDSDCTSVEGDEDVVTRDISSFRTAADVVGEMVAVDEARALAYAHSSPAHSRQGSAQVPPMQAVLPMPMGAVAVPIAVPGHAAAMFAHPHHDEEVLPAYQEANQDDDAASDVASSLMADGYRPGCSGTYTPSESGSQGASDILGDTKH